MAASILPGYPAYPRHSYIVTLGETRYRFTFTWRERPRSWYMDMELPDGTELVKGRRLSAGWSPLSSVDLGEHSLDGVLICRGPDAYERADWGSALVLAFVPLDDLVAAVTVEPSTLTFEVA